MNHTITHLNHKITCRFEYIEAGSNNSLGNSYSGYYWITTSEVPYYPCPLVARTLKELEAEVKSVIDRWS